MTIFTPNIVISKSYEFMNKFMAGAKLSDISSEAINDSLMFLNKQNRYVYSLEHSNNFGHSDMGLTLKIVDTDGDFENQFLNETFYENLMAKKIEDYLKSNSPGREFNNYFASIVGAQIKLYVAYGVGDDLNNWSDPIVCTLVAANIDVANNGLRKYTYQFHPVPNNLFVAPPKKDPNDPNSSDLLNLGVANISITSELKLTDPANATMNVKDILTKFCSKVSQTPIDNVVVVLPDFDEKYAVWCKENTFSGTDGLSKAYSVLFKSIRGEFIAGQTVLNAINLNLTRAKTAFVDYLNEQEKKSLQKVKEDARKKYQAAQSPRTGKNAIERAKELKQIDKEITQLNEALQRDTAPRYADINSKRKEELDKLEKRKRDLELDRQTGSISSKDKEVENAYQDMVDTSDAEDAQRKYGSLAKNSLTNLINKIPTSISTKEVKTPDSFILTMLSQADGQNKDNEPKIPDSRSAILQVFEGINSILFDDNVVPAMAYETNMRFLKLFKEAGIIANDQIPCFIIGDRELILRYLYCKKYTKNLEELTYSMNSKDPLASIITNKSYGEKFKKMIVRGKTNSSFSESLAVDELSLDNQITKESLVEYEKYSRGLDYPIFVNNFRNSNVLSYSLKNSENYIKATTNSVRDNRLKYLYKTLDDNKKNQLLKKFGIDPIGKSPIEISKEFFNEGFKFLGQDKTIAEKKIPIAQASILDEAINKDYTKWQSVDSKTSEEIKSVFYKYDPTRKWDERPKDKLKGLVLTHSSEGVSYLNLAIQSEIKSFAGNTVNQADLGALSELIILLNESDNKSDNTALNLIPGLTMPGTGFILSRLHEYSKKMSTEMAIKTLPFFYLSNIYDINKKCAFYSKRNQFMGRPSEKVIFDFFSGEYLITGFRHVITTSECYSEFLLTKSGTSDDITITRKLKSVDKIKAEAQAKAEKRATDEAINKIDINK